LVMLSIMEVLQSPTEELRLALLVHTNFIMNETQSLL
jgi:hypothetical protein